MELTAVPVAADQDYDDDLDSPNKYVRLAAEIRALVKAGRLRPGDPVPSIGVLSAERGWARQTCAKALRLLTDEGLLRRFDGSGYHVARTPRNRVGPTAARPRRS